MSTEKPEKPIYYCFHCGKQLPDSKRIRKKDKHHYCNRSCVAKAQKAQTFKRNINKSRVLVDPLKKLDSQDDILSGY